MNIRFLRKILPAAILVFALSGMQVAQAQLKEPDVKRKSNPATPLSNGYHNGLDFDISLNNFGFGIGGQYSRVVGPYTELTFKTGITGIRDVSEQSFQDFFTGQRIIPNKYKRALGFPFLIGVEQRLFAEQIADNFRFFVSSAGGPAMTFVYPYVQDTDNNGLRTSFINQFGQIQFSERVNDFFSGWKNGETKWGASGEVKIGVTFGEDFKRQTTIEFGYFFYYFDQGLQIMEPRAVDRDAPNTIRGYDPQTGQIAATEPFFGPQKYFGTPQITISFGGMW